MQCPLQPEARVAAGVIAACALLQWTRMKHLASLTRILLVGALPLLPTVAMAQSPDGPLGPDGAASEVRPDVTTDVTTGVGRDGLAPDTVARDSATTDSAGDRPATVDGVSAGDRPPADTQISATDSAALPPTDANTSIDAPPSGSDAARTDAAARPKNDDGGCGCRVGGTAGSGASAALVPALIGAGLLLRWRRRRR